MLPIPKERKKERKTIFIFTVSVDFVLQSDAQSRDLNTSQSHNRMEPFLSTASGSDAAVSYSCIILEQVHLLKVNITAVTYDFLSYTSMI